MDWNKLYDKAYTWIVEQGPKVLVAIILFIVGQWLIRLLRNAVRRSMERRRFHASLQPFLISFIVTLLNVMLVLAAFQVMGIQLTVFTTIIGALTVAIGLALSGTLQNFTSGLLILLLKPFKTGDNIIAQGSEGTVTSIQLFYTIVTTFDNRTVILPNSKLANEIIINTSREGKRRLDVEMKLNYSVDFEAICNIIQDTLAKTAVFKDPRPRISVGSLEPDGYKIMINAWTNAHGFTDTRYDMNVKLLNNLKAAGIKLPGM
jgi:small conductance mechanosensitive channel